MKQRYLYLAGLIGLVTASSYTLLKMDTKNNAPETGDFEYISEQFADLQILRYQVHGFDQLAPKEKELLY